MEELVVGTLYSNEEIYISLGVSNAGGIRLNTRDGAVIRAVIMTSDRSSHAMDENPYRDRFEDGILTYTAAGRVGEQTLAGMNNRIREQREFTFPIHGFTLVASRRDKSVGPKRWRYLGLLEYMRHYPDTQIDSTGQIRKVWLFEFKVHHELGTVPLAMDMTISGQTILASRARHGARPDEEIVETGNQGRADQAQIEQVRGRLLSMEPPGLNIS